MSWDNKNGKHFGHVCATCDRKLGRANLMKYMSLPEAIAFERYLKETVNLLEYPDFPQWLVQKNLLTADSTKSERPYDIEAEELKGLNLPPRAFNALYRNQITIDNLVDMSTEELMKIHQLGLESVTAIQKALKEYEGRQYAKLN